MTNFKYLNVDIRIITKLIFNLVKLRLYGFSLHSLDK